MPTKKSKKTFDYNEILKRNSVCLHIFDSHSESDEAFHFSSLDEAYFFLYHYWKGGKSIATKRGGISGYLDVQNFKQIVDFIRAEAREDSDFGKQLKKVTFWKGFLKEEFAVYDDDFGFSLNGKGIWDVLVEVNKRYDLETLYPFKDFKNYF